MAKGSTDTDMGLKAIFKEMGKLKSLCVKVGVTEDVGSQTTDSGATLAQIAAWNELGVLGPPFSQHGSGKWFIPPRPFIRGFADGKHELTAQTMEKLSGQVSGGKITAETALRQLGQYGQDGVKSYIRDGTFTQNADSTIAKKGSSHPLIDTGTLRNSVRYQVIEKPVDKVKK
ncbi:MAG: hypothetical protein LBO67_04790 [Spirochaetaceae bacterium]|jgi:hypothetical protein|nr:hypothetical protein [Spirochaetaceae bacterium]